MPSPSEILASLESAVNDAIPAAIAWHVVTVAGAVALALHWRPSRRRAGALLSTPIASAAVVAFTHGNPFNGTVLGALALALLGVASRIDAGVVRRAPAPRAIAGLGMIAFGMFYPHFLAPRPLAMYLVAAPVGLIPCPTLSLVIGFSLLAGGLGSRTWSLMLAVVGLFYGLFGALRLGVLLDLGLVAGAAALLVTAVRSPAVHARRPASRDAAHLKAA
jgi:hypothetical protein